MAEAQAEQEDGQGLLEATLSFIARSLVEHPDDVRVEALDGERGFTLRLHVNPDDMGRVIGRQGHVARAIRQVMRATSTHAGVRAYVEIAG